MTTAPENWKAIAAVLRLAAAEGRHIGDRRKLTAMAGLRGSKADPHPDANAMIAAGALLTQVRLTRGRGREVRFGLPDGTWCAWPEVAEPSSYDRACRAIRTAAMGGAGYGTARALGVAGGIPAEVASGRVLGLCDKGHLRREVRPRAGGGQEVSWVIVETGERTPWAIAAIAGFDAQAAGSDGASGARASSVLIRAASHKARLHRMRMARAVSQSEAELKALVDAHIAAHGVTRIETPVVPENAAAMPVRGRGGRAVGDGSMQARSR
jgi:hypothetical protein